MQGLPAADIEAHIHAAEYVRSDECDGFFVFAQ
jgi:hypothetical protein